MKINLKMAVIIAAAAVLTACGSSGGDAALPTKVVTADIVVPATASTAPAVLNVPFTFPGGVSELGTTGTTNVTFTSATATPNFTIDNLGGKASGTTTFGSCIFRVTDSTFPASHPLALNNVVTIDPCTFSLKIAGALANGSSAQRDILLQLGRALSNATKVNVTINAAGQILVNNNPIGTASVQDVSGGSN